MKFTMSLSDLETLLSAAGVSKPKKAETLTLSACAARVFVDFQGDFAGIEEIVLSDGAVTVPAAKFSTLLKTYKGTRFLNIEGGPNGLKVQNFTMPVLAWNPQPDQPAHFYLFPVSQVQPGAGDASKSASREL